MVTMAGLISKNKLKSFGQMAMVTKMKETTRRPTTTKTCDGAGFVACNMFTPGTIAQNHRKSDLKH